MKIRGLGNPKESFSRLKPSQHQEDNAPRKFSELVLIYLELFGLLLMPSLLSAGCGALVPGKGAPTAPQAAGSKPASTVESEQLAVSPTEQDRPDFGILKVALPDRDCGQASDAFPTGPLGQPAPPLSLVAGGPQLDGSAGARP